MAYQYTNSRGNKYFLHSRTTTLRNGKEQRIFYFAREPKEGTLEKVPEGYTVSETANGLPVLKKTNK
ncbi:MAG TPA: hypothetical protein VFF68_00220 [Anaerolineaceae bacterium]|nr:hypothetical protein [Anaerolineaceae bacterium]